MTPSSKPPLATAGLTLIELLVVVSILTVLMAILLPVLWPVTTTAKITKATMMDACLKR